MMGDYKMTLRVTNQQQQTFHSWCDNSSMWKRLRKDTLKIMNNCKQIFILSLPTVLMQ